MEKRNSKLSVLPWWLLLASLSVITVLLGVACIRAEEHGAWYVAQGAFGVALFLVLGAVWLVLELKHKEHGANTKQLGSPDFEVYSETLLFLLRFAGAGLFAVVFNALRYEFWTHGIVARAASVGILLAGMAFIIGTLLGFLFGFPPSPTPLQTSGNQALATSVSGGTGNRNQQPQLSFYSNTNLQEISDWLTKVIVGASLVELTKFPPYLWRIAKVVAAGVNPVDPSPTVALALLGYFSSCGVLYGYLWTKYEIAATSQRLNNDSIALAAVDDWLHRGPDPKDDPQSVIDAVKAASQAARMRILLETEKYRTGSDEKANDRALPILKSLVEADPEGNISS